MFVTRDVLAGHVGDQAFDERERAHCVTVTGSSGGIEESRVMHITSLVKARQSTAPPRSLPVGRNFTGDPQRWIEADRALRYRRRPLGRA
jgi:hypothetical protein